MSSSQHRQERTWEPDMSTRHQLAAVSGQDADFPLPEDLRRMLSTSPETRKTYEQMQNSLKVLTQSAEQTAELPRSMWPELKSRLPMPSQPARQKNRSWQEIKETYIPIFSTLAAGIAVTVVLWESQYSRNTTVYKAPSVQAPSESFVSPASYDSLPNYPLYQPVPSLEKRTANLSDLDTGLHNSSQHWQKLPEASERYVPYQPSPQVFLDK